MMCGLEVILLSFAVAFVAPQVEVSTFQGEPRAGEFRGLAEGRVVISASGTEEKIALSEVLEIRFRGEAATKFEKPVAMVALADGSLLSGSQATVSGKQLRLTSPVIGELTVPQSDVTSLRFADRFTSVDEQWNKLVERERKSDLL